MKKLLGILLSLTVLIVGIAVGMMIMRKKLSIVSCRCHDEKKEPEEQPEFSGYPEQENVPEDDGTENEI